VIGYGAIEGGPEPGAFRLFIVMAPGLLSGRIGVQMYDRLAVDLDELYAARVWAREEATDLAIIGFLTARGFVETQRFSIPSGPEIVVLERREQQ
jgi:hypothetical protein